MIINITDRYFYLGRERNGIKAYELAKRSGISKSAMSKLENNNLEPSYKLVYKVVKALNELAEFKGSRNTVKEKMMKNPISVSPDESITNARKIMKKRDISQIPVIDKNGNILGIITEKSILDNQNGIKCSDSMELLCNFRTGF
ncbi:CBS domain-containing protein [Candidatus Parvarchaeota archaeon]|nr:CBS domain-containing protein [Candidatus Parvarchaeota archaeon]